MRHSVGQSVEMKEKNVPALTILKQLSLWCLLLSGKSVSWKGKATVDANFSFSEVNTVCARCLHMLQMSEWCSLLSGNPVSWRPKLRLRI